MYHMMLNCPDNYPWSEVLDNQNSQNIAKELFAKQSRHHSQHPSQPLPHHFHSEHLQREHPSLSLSDPRTPRKLLPRQSFSNSSALYSSKLPSGPYSSVLSTPNQAPRAPMRRSNTQDSALFEVTGKLFPFVSSAHHCGYQAHSPYGIQQSPSSTISAQTTPSQASHKFVKRSLSFAASPTSASSQKTSNNITQHLPVHQRIPHLSTHSPASLSTHHSTESSQGLDAHQTSHSYLHEHCGTTKRFTQVVVPTSVEKFYIAEHPSQQRQQAQLYYNHKNRSYQQPPLPLPPSLHLNSSLNLVDVRRFSSSSNSLEEIDTIYETLQPVRALKPRPPTVMSPLRTSVTTIKNTDHFDVFLDLEECGLGMSIKGGTDSPDSRGSTEIFISRILANGAVFNDGRLLVGDILLQVNKNSLSNVAHAQAVGYIKKAFPYVHFTVKRHRTPEVSEIYEEIANENDPLLCDSGNSSSEYGQLWSSGGGQSAADEPNSFDNSLIRVSLTRTPNGFGLSLTGGSDNQVTVGDTNLYVSRIVENGPAHLSGQINVGDQIVAINNSNLECVTYQQALGIIRNSPPTAVITVRRNLTWH